MDWLLGRPEFGQVYSDDVNALFDRLELLIVLAGVAVVLLVILVVRRAKTGR